MVKFKVMRKGDPFQLGVLHSGDSRECLGHLPDGCAQTAIFSPPYPGLRGETSDMSEYRSKMAGVLASLLPKLKDNGTIVNVNRFKTNGLGLFDMEQFRFWVDLYDSCGANIIQMLIWVKSNPVPAGYMKWDNPSFEFIYAAAKKGCEKRDVAYKHGDRDYAKKTVQKAMSGSMRSGERYNGGDSSLRDKARGFDYIVAPVGRASRTEPVAQGGSFSLSLVNELLDRFSEKGDLVLDPFAGVCTTGKSCVIKGRKFWGCDVNESDLRKGCDWLNEPTEVRLI